MRRPAASLSRNAAANRGFFFAALTLYFILPGAEAGEGSRRLPMTNGVLSQPYCCRNSWRPFRGTATMFFPFAQIFTSWDGRKEQAAPYDLRRPFTNHLYCCCDTRHPFRRTVDMIFAAVFFPFHPVFHLLGREREKGASGSLWLAP
ncbi:hypothetical protein NDU88_002763 [Pleurodeles waltl]|uniref:Secreted protein n=1 Tax=Pleurodeles waltl TaxID=8319 RepID=A0AAV7LGT9_PLEWA|nr:hypothetical protein NDU88_002763 [Pleurodeles waltl]